MAKPNIHPAYNPVKLVSPNGEIIETRMSEVKPGEELLLEINVLDHVAWKKDAKKMVNEMVVNITKFKKKAGAMDLSFLESSEK